MDMTKDEFLKVIQTIELTQQQLATETDPTRIKHLHDFLDLSFKRLSDLTHRHSVKEYQRDHEARFQNPDREI